MEIWDLYDRDGNCTGETVEREKYIPEGMFHKVSLILVEHDDGTFLLMQRAPNKKHAGRWEASAGGSALAGEDEYECALRELREETGVSNVYDVRIIGQEVDVEKQCLFYYFRCLTSVKKDSIVLQEGETSDYKWVDYDELISTDVYCNYLHRYLV